MADVTVTVPPLFLAQLFGIYRIDQGIRVVKMYRYDGTVSHRVLRSELPKEWDSLDFVGQVEEVKKVTERTGM